MPEPSAQNDAPPLVWLLCGGPSNEHEVSISSGSQVAEALATGPWQVRPVVIDRSGRWRLADSVVGPDGAADGARAMIAALRRPDVPALECEQALAQLRIDRPAAVFIALHGAGGEDGALQGMLEWLGVPYTGSGPAASALAMDKIRSLILFRAMGFQTPPAVSTLDVATADRLCPDRHRAALRALALERLRPPLFVKPSAGGSSVGVTRASGAETLDRAIDAALDCAEEVLIEAAIAGRELTCGVVDRLDADGRPVPQALPVTEISPVEAEFFDYTAKYTAGATREITPAPLDAEQTLQVQRLALRAHTALGCRGMSRSDFMMDANGGIFILETNTIPGMTPTSLLPQAAEVAGMSFAALCQTIIASALATARRPDRVPK